MPGVEGIGVDIHVDIHPEKTGDEVEADLVDGVQGTADEGEDDDDFAVLFLEVLVGHDQKRSEGEDDFGIKPRPAEPDAGAAEGTKADGVENEDEGDPTRVK